jgi:hypothetical protein
MTSVSKQLVIDVQQMMNIVGVYSYISKPKKAATNNRGSQNITPLNIKNGTFSIFKGAVSVTI